MSLSKTPSAFSLPTLNLTNSSSSDASSDKEKEKAEKEDTGTSLSQSRSQQQNNDTADLTDAPSSPRSPRGNGPRPRRAVTFRELGMSEQLTVRPISTASSATQTSSVTSVGKVAPSGSPAREKTNLASTPPRLSSRSSSGALPAPPLSAEQQQYEDLADFVFQQRFGKKSVFDTEIPIENVPKSLLHCVTNLKKPTVRISEMMIQLFRKDLNNSNTWVIASEMAVKIKNTFYFLSASPQAKNEKQKDEETNLLELCAANFAGAFFNLSTDDKLGRLPASLIAFLEAADHRLIRASGSPGKEGSPDDQAFLKKRHDLLKFLLLDSFLIPIVQQDIFTLQGVVHVDRVVSAIIKAFHEAVDQIAHAFFAHSIRTARPEVVHDFAMRRISQLRQKPGSDKAVNINTAVLSSDNPNHLVESLSPRNPIQDRRKELIHLLKELRQKLKPLELPDDLLEAIREEESEIARSLMKIDKLKVWEGWLDIAIQQDPHAKLTAAIRDVVEQERERQLIDHMLLHIDSSGHIVTTSTVLPATSTTTATTTTTITTTTTSIAAPVPATTTTTTTITAPATSSTNNSNTAADASLRNNASSTQARRPITRTPRMIRGKPIETPNASSPEPASPRPLARHQRSRTADAVMPVSSNVVLQLSDAGRQALLAAFPELMLAAMKKIASRHPEHPVDVIRESQRNKLMLELPPILQTPENAPLFQPISAEFPSTIGHDRLLRMLLIQTAANSPAGKILSVARTQSINFRRNAVTALASSSDSNLSVEAEKLKAQAVSYAAQAVQELFGAHLADSGLPAELIDLWIRVDQLITTWAREKKVDDEGVEELRSTTGFDLIATRVLYPLAMGIEPGTPSTEALRFAGDIRNKVNAVWPEIFRQFKKLTDDRQSVPMQFTSTASSASSSSSDSVPMTEKKQ